MKFFAAIVAYVLMAGLLGWGVLMATHGSFWLLIAALVGYVVLFARIGCLPAKSH